MRLAVLSLAVLGIGLSSAADAGDLIVPVDGFQTTVIGSNNALWGWIELKNGNEIAGYIYFTDKKLREPYLSCSKSCVVMDAPSSMLDTLLGILKSEKPLQIRFAESAPPMAFLEHRFKSATPASAMENAPRPGSP